MAKKKDFLLLSKSGRTRRVNKYLKPTMNIINTQDEGILGFIEAIFKCIFIIGIVVFIIYFAVKELFFS